MLSIRRVSFEQGKSLQLVGKVELYDEIQKVLSHNISESDGRMAGGFVRRTTDRYLTMLRARQHTNNRAGSSSYEYYS